MTTLAAEYTTRIIQTTGELQTILSDWERCRQQQQLPRLEQHPAWVAHKADREPPKQLRVILLYRNAEVVGVAPLLLYNSHTVWRVRLPGGSWTLVRYPMQIADFCGESLMAPASEEAQTVLLRAVIAACSSNAVIQFTNIDTASLLWQVLHTSPESRGGRWLWHPGDTSRRWMIRLNDTFDNYLQQQFPSKMRSNLRREMRQLAQATNSALTLHCITTRDQVARFLEQAEEVSLHSWQAQQQGFHIRASEHQTRLTEMADQGWLQCYLLTCGDTPLAFVTGHQSDGIYYPHLTAYHLQWAQWSPGKVLWLQILEHLHTQKTFQWMDFGRGDWDYKQFFSNDCYQERSLMLIQRSFYTGLAFAAPVAFGISRQLVLSGLERVGIESRVRRWIRRNLGR